MTGFSIMGTVVVKWLKIVALNISKYTISKYYIMESTAGGPKDTRRPSGVFIVNFEQISHIGFVF